LFLFTHASLDYFLAHQHDEVRKRTCCPTFLIATAGAWFTVLGAAFTDKWIVQRLTDFIWVRLSATLDEPHYDRVARIMDSLRRNVWKLHDYYHGLDVVATVPNGLHPRYFPSVRAYGDATRSVTTFDYIQPLEIESTCATFLAQTTSGIPKLIVVKFVQRYGETAHRLLAKENLAPELFYYGHIGVQDGDPSYGHLRMVVMEYIDGETLDKVKRIPRTSRDQIRRALDLLHKSGYVFGDLRQPNVMITKNQEIKLIDFDWAGEHMKARYPALTNGTVLIVPYVALLVDLWRQCRNLQIRQGRWEPGAIVGAASVVLVTSDMSVKVEFREYLTSLSTRLRTIVYEECHV
jgi:serine/threonine protein kinase